MFDRSHRRYNPLLREWVLVSPHRLSRPWQGRSEAALPLDRPAYDPSCYLCPGNPRAGGARNPHYTGTFVFDNDFSAFAEAPAGRPGLPDRAASGAHPLLLAVPERGICRVVCFSPRHDLSIPELGAEDLRAVVDVWADQYAELSARPGIGYVQIFENRGAAMGASNPHPHCQIWATESIPDLARREQEALVEHAARRNACLLCEYLEVELRDGQRIVMMNDAFVALVPFWAVWPFELLVLPRRHVAAIDALTADERNGFAAMLRDATRGYDALFDAPCPYSMGIHQQGTDRGLTAGWHLHTHFYTPVLRSAEVHKFMVGFELLGNPQRDLTAELAAERLRVSTAARGSERGRRTSESRA